MSTYFCHTTRSGVAVKIDEYVPTRMPEKSVKTKGFSVDPPIKSNVASVIRIVIEVLIDRPSVWTTLSLEIVEKLWSGNRRTFSRIRSKTTIVS